MALVIVLLVLILALAFFYLKCTMMQSFLTLWSSIVATILTFTYYEAVAGLFISRGYGLQWAHFGSYLVIFIVVFALLRSGGEYLIGVKIDLGNMAKASTAIVCGFITGIILSGNLLVAMGHLPMQGAIFYSRFPASKADPDSDKAGRLSLADSKTPALNTDGFVSGLYGLISSGSFSSGKSFNVYHADYLSQIHLNKFKVKQVLPVTSPEAVKLPPKEKRPVRIRTFDDKEYIVVRMGIKSGKIEKGGAGTMEFFPGQIRLIVKDDAEITGPKANPFAGSAKALYPVGFVEDRKLVEKGLNETQSPDFKKLKKGIFWQDVAFDMKQGCKPIMLQFKQNAAFNLESYSAVNSSEEIEAALDSDDADEGEG